MPIRLMNFSELHMTDYCELARLFVLDAAIFSRGKLKGPKNVQTKKARGKNNGVLKNIFVHWENIVVH